MNEAFEDLLARAKRARRDEIRRAFLLAAVVLARRARRFRAPRVAWVPAVWRLGPEDRPGC